MTKFSIKTLGCKVNQYEEQVLRENLIRFGLEESSIYSADVIIVNSCTVTVQADSKTRNLIRKLKKENSRSKIFVTGCYAVLEEDIKKLQSLPEVYQVVSGRDKMKLPYILSPQSFSSRHLEESITGFSSHTRAFLKIQDGCDQNCSYCKVSLIRGYSRCRDEKNIIRELEFIVNKGYKEIVLTGICLGAWKGTQGRSFSDLLIKIDGLNGNFRIRLSSIEPKYIDDSLIKVLAGSKRICRHLHIPLQSGSDRILKLMGRHYTAEQFKKLAKRIRREMPLIGLTMDVIVGFPGESEAEFEQTLKVITRIKPSRLHVFKYSDRKGTRSFFLKDKVPSDIAKRRVKTLIKINEKLKAEFCRSFIGKEVEVLTEKRNRSGYLEGYTGEYIKAKLTEGTEGDIVRTVYRLETDKKLEPAGKPAENYEIYL